MVSIIAAILFSKFRFNTVQSRLVESLILGKLQLVKIVRKIPPETLKLTILSRPLILGPTLLARTVDQRPAFRERGKLSIIPDRGPSCRSRLSLRLAMIIVNDKRDFSIERTRKTTWVAAR